MGGPKRVEILEKRGGMPMITDQEKKVGIFVRKIERTKDISQRGGYFKFLTMGL